MRVIAGTARRMVLHAPIGDAIRPTTDRLKEMVFNTIQYKLQGAMFLDLFSGTGAIAIEAISRGATKAILVEETHRAIACIEKNLD
jgi:16S rRNA (guanine966-N2)-methyltransferase